MGQSVDGFSLVEKLLVVAVLGIVATIAIPRLSSYDAGKIDLAASEIVEALRFARAESMRSGDVFGVTVDEDADRVIVFKAKMDPLPIAPDYIVYHPVRKQLWDVSFGASPTTSGVDVDSTGGPFEYLGLAAQPTVLFNPRGRPFGVDTATGATYRLDEQTRIRLDYDEHDRDIQLDPMNGRVTVDN